MKNKIFFNLFAGLIVANFITAAQASPNEEISNNENNISIKSTEEKLSNYNLEEFRKQISENSDKIKSLFDEIANKNERKLESWQNIKFSCKSMGKLIADHSPYILTLETDKINFLLKKVMGQIGIIEALDAYSDVKKSQCGNDIMKDLFFFPKFPQALMNRILSCFGFKNEEHYFDNFENWNDNAKHRLLAALVSYVDGINFIHKKYSSLDSFHFNELIEEEEYMIDSGMSHYLIEKNEERKKFIDLFLKSKFFQLFKYKDPSILPYINIKDLFHIKLLDPKFSTVPHGVINTTIEDYLIKHKTPKLLLVCGHEPNRLHSSYTTGDFLGCRDFHTHDGWYTIDLNFSIAPDLVADLLDEDTLKYLDNFKGELTLVYPEYAIPDVGWSKGMLQKIYHNLSHGGAFINIYRPLGDNENSLQNVMKKLEEVGFKKENIIEYNLPLDSTYFAERLKKYFEIKNIKEPTLEDVKIECLEPIDFINNVYEYNIRAKKIVPLIIDGEVKLIENKDYRDYEVLKNLLTENLPAVFKHQIETLKALRSIDPMFEWGLCSNNYIVAYKK